MGWLAYYYPTVPPSFTKPFVAAHHLGGRGRFIALYYLVDRNAASSQL